jgi:Fe-S-cluster containining protein
LTKSEALAISKRTNLDADDFTEGPSQNRNFLSLKAYKGKCYFYDSGRCSIYEDRPLDCRLFPFDIVQAEDGNFYWIVYNEFCPESFDYRLYFSAAKRLLAYAHWSRDEVDRFASHGHGLVQNHAHTIIEQVTLEVI